MRVSAVRRHQTRSVHFTPTWHVIVLETHRTYVWEGLSGPSLIQEHCGTVRGVLWANFEAKSRK